MNTLLKLKQLEAIFTEAPIEVKHFANRLYLNKSNTRPFIEVFAIQDMEPQQVTCIEETIQKAFNLYLSPINTLVMRLHALEDEAA